MIFTSSKGNFFPSEDQELILSQRSLRYSMWNVTSVHQDNFKIFEAILSSPRNTGGYRERQAEASSDDGRLQTLIYLEVDHRRSE